MKNWLLLVLVGFVSSVSFGQAKDDQTRDLLVSKFEKVLLSLAPQDPSYNSVGLRLADLYAERARVESMRELEKGCLECNAGVKDRQKALKLYEASLAKTPVENQGRILLQIGHLNEILGQTQKAEATYLGIVKSNTSPVLVADSRAALGEMYFKQRRFALAREQFEVARKGDLGQKGLAAYRIAWCFFNEGNVGEAARELKSILQSPKLLTRNADSTVVSVDKQFQEEVSRDYATFVARLGATRETATELFNLSPDSTRVSNLEFLASELERLGHKDKAIQVWQLVQERQTQPRNKLEGHVRLAQLFQDQGQMPLAIVEFERGLAIWPQVGCDNSCSEIKSRLRGFVIEWHKGTKKNPTADTLEGYEKYLEVFPEDSEMTFWSAQLAKDLKSWERSQNLFQRYVEGAKKKLVTAQGKEKTDLVTNIENALLSQIEVGELSKNPGLQTVAYDRYLQNTQKGDRLVDVQYQKAHILYEAEKYQEAAVALREVALLKTQQSESIREQAADLSLDALALLKDDVRLEAWGLEFADKFPKKRAEFQSVARKSVLNQSASAVTTGGGQLENAWAVLARVDLSGADNSDRITYYKNRIILAEKLKKYSEARNAADALLKIPNLKAEDEQFALARKAWLAELALDFPTAYNTNQKLKLQELSPDQKALRLAMFAELADQSATPLYQQYLATTQDKENARLVTARLVRESKEPAKDLKKYDSVLKEDGKLKAQLILEIYAKTKDKNLLKMVVSDKALASTPAGAELLRESILLDIAPVVNQVAGLSIGTKTQAEISKGIKTRVSLIEKLEGYGSQALESRDWLAQVVALSYLEREVSRFYNELVALPVPAGLSAEEEGQYLQLLSQQASPYQLKASDIQSKLKEFWSGGGHKVIAASYENLAGDLRQFIGRQIEVLSQVSPQAEKAELVAALAAKPAGAAGMPSVADVEAARRLVLESPMNSEYLMKLSHLERQMGRSTMASYLEARAQKAGEKKNE